MVATNDDILTALNKLIDINTPKPNTDISKVTVWHDNIEVELNKDDGKYYPKK